MGMIFRLVQCSHSLPKSMLKKGFSLHSVKCDAIGVKYFGCNLR